MQLEMVEDKEALAVRATDVIAESAAVAIADSGSFSLAVSGGSTPKRMLELLAERTDIEWPKVHLFQVDERIAPAGADDRNVNMLLPLLDAVTLGSFWPMEVEAANLDESAGSYAAKLAAVGGLPPKLDLIQLGLGSDGHTASLIPDDPVLKVEARDVAVTGEYQGRRRMTLTWPVLDRAKAQLWLVAGVSKREALQQLLTGDASIPATLPTLERALVLADRAALLS